MHAVPLHQARARESKPIRASSPLQRYPAHRRGSSEATSGLGGRRAKKPPGLRLATAHSGARAEPPNRRRKGAHRPARQINAPRSIPALATAYSDAPHPLPGQFASAPASIPGTYCTYAAPLATSPQPARRSFQAFVAATADGEHN